jgi:AraC-like DNA-binding protein
MEDVFGPAGRDLVNRMGQDGPDAAVRHLGAFLEARLAARFEERRLEAAIRSSRSVEALADAMNLSLRSAHEHAVRATGFGPKRLLRIARLHEALEIARADDATWSATAYRAGFADQAHMVREFRALLGDSPQAWRRRATADFFKTRSAARP